jgi:signal transduction histidine kinase
MEGSPLLSQAHKSPIGTSVTANTRGIGRRLLEFWDQLTAPQDFVPQHDRRQARLISATLVVFVALSIVITILIPVVSALVTGRPLSLPIDFVIEEFLYIGIYALSRTKYYKVAALLITLVVNLVVWYITVTVPTVDGAQLLAIVAVLAGLLLSTRNTAILFALNFVGLLIGSVIQQKTTFNPAVNFPNAISLYIVFFGLFLVHMRYRDLLEQDRIREAIRAEDERRAADQLRALDQIKSRFLASMSHELRTPLNSILNFSEFVLNGVFGPVNKEQADALQNVVSSGDFLLSLINDVLDMTKIESSSLELFLEDVELSDLIKTSLATAQGLLQDKPITLMTNIADDLPVILGDKRRIQQILNNLISNAIKFTVKGTITFEAARDGEDNIRFTVKDTGTGIAAADQELVFQPFRQTKQGKAFNKEQGPGLDCRSPAASQKLMVVSSSWKAHSAKVQLFMSFSRAKREYQSL